MLSPVAVDLGVGADAGPDGRCTCKPIIIQLISIIVLIYIFLITITVCTIICDYSIMYRRKQFEKWDFSVLVMAEQALWFCYLSPE